MYYHIYVRYTKRFEMLFFVPVLLSATASARYVHVIGNKFLSRLQMLEILGKYFCYNGTLINGRIDYRNVD